MASRRRRDLRRHQGRQAFTLKATETETNRQSVHSAVKYDLIGKLAEGTQLTRRTIG
jgi:type III restriction enzyme